jgi:DNA-binding CsgD family transcriptional regulator
MKAIKIGLWTAFSIIIMQCLGLLVVYDFFTFDVYSTVIAIAFLLIGYFLVPGTKREDYSLENSIRKLTGRELSVFRLLAQGKTNKEIANIMMVEVSTIKTHTNNLYAKIGCKNRNDARNLWMKISPSIAI